jgi:putative nucleotidyltransferase with HDIG domain
MDTAYDPSSNSPIENRAQIVQGIQQSNTEEVMENPDLPEVYTAAKDGAARYAEFLNSDVAAFQHIMNIENLDANIAHHGVSVSTLSLALAKRLGLSDDKQNHLLALGALLHDIGHFQTTLELNRPLKNFSAEEMLTYRNHPNDGRDKMSGKPHIDRSVLNIIQQHEEFIDGKGFPAGLTESKMDPLAVIVASCNALDRLLTFEGVKRSEAVKTLLLSGVGRYPLNHIQILGDILKTMKMS